MKLFFVWYQCCHCPRFPFASLQPLFFCYCVCQKTLQHVKTYKKILLKYVWKCFIYFYYNRPCQIMLNSFIIQCCFACVVKRFKLKRDAEELATFSPPFCFCFKVLIIHITIYVCLLGRDFIKRQSVVAFVFGENPLKLIKNANRNKTSPIFE